MPPEQNRRAVIRTGGAPDRQGEAVGPEAADDPRLREQLDHLTGMRLSQFSMAVAGIRLAFWGEQADEVAREIVIEQEVLDVAPSGEPAATLPWDDVAVATSLLGLLNQLVVRVDATGGRLGLEFEHGLRLRVEPDEHYESWQISSDDGFLIVCGPGGGLSVWYPHRER